MASTEGTPAKPISQINVSKTVESTGVIKVGFLLSFDVEGDMDGTIKGFGDDPNVPSIQYVVINGKVQGGHLLAKVLSSVEVGRELRGNPQREHPPADFQSVTIGGSVLPGSVIDAASGGTLSVAGDFSGEAILTGPLDTLSVGGTLDGTVSAGSIGTQTLSGPVTGPGGHRPRERPAGEHRRGRCRGTDPGDR